MRRKSTGDVQVDARVKALAAKPEWNEADAAAVVAAWRASGANLEAFARAHGTSAQRIRNWRDGRFGTPASRTGAKAKERPTLLPAKVVATTAPTSISAASSSMEVVLNGGRSIRVGADFDAVALTRLLTTLEGLPC